MADPVDWSDLGLVAYTLGEVAKTNRALIEKRATALQEFEAKLTAAQAKKLATIRQIAEALRGNATTCGYRD